MAGRVDRRAVVVGEDRRPGAAVGSQRQHLAVPERVVGRRGGDEHIIVVGGEHVAGVDGAPPDAGERGGRLGGRGGGLVHAVHPPVRRARVGADVEVQLDDVPCARRDRAARGDLGAVRKMHLELVGAGDVADPEAVAGGDAHTHEAIEIRAGEGREADGDALHPGRAAENPQDVAGAGVVLCDAQRVVAVALDRRLRGWRAPDRVDLVEEASTRQARSDRGDGTRLKVVGAASGHAGIVKASCVEGAGGARF